MISRWKVNMKVSPYTDRNNIKQYWFEVSAAGQIEAAIFALQHALKYFPQHRMIGLLVTVDHQPLPDTEGVICWSEHEGLVG